MYFLKIVFCLFLTNCIFCQSNASAEQLLDQGVNSCLQASFDEDNILPNGNNKGNSYKERFWTSSECDCQCIAQSQAFKNNKGRYITINYYSNSCTWTEKDTSTEDLKALLPENFGIGQFGKELATTRNEFPVFFIKLQLSPNQNQISAQVKLVPFGLRSDTRSLSCFAYTAEGNTANCVQMTIVKEIAENIHQESTLDNLISGNFDRINPSDQETIKNLLAQSNTELSMKEIQQMLKELHEVYLMNNSLETSQIKLNWNPKISKFEMAQKDAPLQKISFRIFLIENRYWQPAC